MTKETLEASIKHWQENVAAETPGDASVSDGDCALCNAYQQCAECPVKKYTMAPYCTGTPYYDAAYALSEWSCAVLKGCNGQREREAWRKAAQAELDFLISLRGQYE